MNCPKCNSNDVDHATIGLPDAMQCLDCGYLFPQVMGLMSWPFPTSLVKKKVSDELPNTNGLSNSQEAPF